MNILSRERHQQQLQPTRNITPNFLRFKSTACAIQSEENSKRVIRKIVDPTGVHHGQVNAASMCMKRRC
jgi:hypothetical protein